jgi:anti-anti-sigma regulatory factor
MMITMHPKKPAVVAPLTDEQHEREHLGLKTVRLDDHALITVYARTLNGLNAPQLQLRADLLREGGVRSLSLDLSRCDKGLDRRAIDVLVAMRNALHRIGGTFTITAMHERAIADLVAVELAHLFEPTSALPAPGEETA